MEKDENVEIYFSCVRDNIPKKLFEEIKSFAKEKRNVFFPSCIEGKNQLHLHNNGDILICELGCPTVIGNILNGTDLNSILQKPPKKLKEFISNHTCKKEYYATK